MEHLVKDIVRMGLLDVQGQHEETAQFLGIVQRVAELLTQDTGFEHICRSLVRVIIEETDFENCSIMLWDSANDRLSLLAAFGLEDLLSGEPRIYYNRNLMFSATEGLAGRALSTQNPIFIEDVETSAIPHKMGAVVQPASLICLPLLRLGILNLSSSRSRKFPRPIQRSWELLARIIGYLLTCIMLRQRSVRVEQALESVNRQEYNTLEQAVKSLPPQLCLSEQAINSTPQGICLLDLEGRVIQTNRSIENWHKTGTAELRGRSPSILFRDPEVFNSLFERVLESQKEELNDVALVNSKGDIYLADVYLARLSDDEGVPTGYILVISDITQRKALNEKLFQTEKLAALGTMAGGVAHDFNNLLMAILGHIQLILPQVADEEILRRLQSIEKAVHDGANTVRRLQKFNERSPDLHALLALADVNEAVTDVMEMTRPRWKNAMERNGRGVKFQVDLEAACFAAINVSDLREVLMNLIFNAIDAMPEGGNITLKARSKGENIVIEVADTGVGMSKEVAGRIFDPFYTTKGVGNSGLGLSVSWSLIARAGGEIQVRSQAGKGTTFTIRLPKVDMGQKHSNAAETERKVGSYRMLIVDDDLEVLGILRDMLRLKGHRVIAVHDGEEALKMLDEERFDAVLSDLGMPTVSGWDIAKRAKEKNPDVPVILITGWGAQYEEEDLSKRGVDLVLSKPLSWEKLVGALEKFL